MLLRPSIRPLDSIRRGSLHPQGHAILLHDARHGHAITHFTRHFCGHRSRRGSHCALTFEVDVDIGNIASGQLALQIATGRAPRRTVHDDAGCGLRIYRSGRWFWLRSSGRRRCRWRRRRLVRSRRCSWKNRRENSGRGSSAMQWEARSGAGTES